MTLWSRTAVDPVTDQCSLQTGYVSFISLSCVRRWQYRVGMRSVYHFCLRRISQSFILHYTAHFYDMMHEALLERLSIAPWIFYTKELCRDTYISTRQIVNNRRLSHSVMYNNIEYLVILILLLEATIRLRMLFNKIGSGSLYLP